MADKPNVAEVIISTKYIACGFVMVWIAADLGGPVMAVPHPVHWMCRWA